jgi:hypothetical protein
MRFTKWTNKSKNTYIKEEEAEDAFVCEDVEDVACMRIYHWQPGEDRQIF